eukprot:CAMPEP_0119012492 /NCGR_PEP_ID=MMETSP1176-20130426/6796_1 /TAXON_ID=265551 /ORGANISM="Synedropsis recta cf, Strain CCMP1620" /LENGTH=268 /DNA_ID=CAMNT_0006965459 /DNA_START=144 /DNA_END=950 /DNA_ORIENTATION=+
MLLTAAAAFGSTLPTACHAFVPPRPIYNSAVVPVSDMGMMQTRVYSSKRDGGTGGLMGSLKSVAKKVLPKRWTQTKEEKTASLALKEQKNAMKSGINAMLKDAPLAVRMMGSLVAPLLSSLASTVQAQQAKTQYLLDDARDFILSDPAARAALGEPIVVQQPFSQASSSASMNGQASSQVQASFYVEGTLQQGVATMSASESGIQSLSLQVGGRTMNIALVKSAGGSTSNSDVFGGAKPLSQSTIGKNRTNKNDIIDVEFIDKTERKQ